MIDREKVIKGLEEALQHWARYSGDEYGREYDYAHVDIETLKDALVLLKAQRARVMMLEEVQLYDNSLTLEIRNAEEDEYNGLHTALHVAELDYDDPPGDVFGIAGYEDTRWFWDGSYKKTWRCWTSRPTDEQREATPWEK